MSQQLPVALVTGANKGIGFAIAKGLVEKGFTVLVGSRNLENGIAAAAVIGNGAHALQLDVTDASSIELATTRIEEKFGRLDVLINNAGISHADRPGLTFPEIIKTNALTATPLEDVRKVWETNVFGVIALTQAMLPLLRKAPLARIVNIGSTGGSLTWNSDPTNTHRAMFGNYSTSKSAVHAVTLAFAFALEPEGIKVNIVCPGHTSTALNNFGGKRSPDEGARQAIAMAMIGVDGPTATFTDENGSVAW